VPDRHLLVVDAAVPVLVAAVIGVGEGLHGGASTGAGSIALGVAAAGTLAGRRRWPGWTLALSGGLVVVLLHLDRSAGTVAVLAPAVALYSVALRRGRFQQLAAGLAAIAAVVISEVIHPGRLTLGQTLGHVLLVAIPLLAAEVIRTHHANLRLLVERIELAEHAREQEAERRVEQERMRIARELHDVVAHSLTEINVTAAAAAEQLHPGQARTAFERIEDTSHNAIGELRAVLGVLRGPGWPEATRTPAPGIDDITELIEQARTTDLRVQLDIAGMPPARISDATSLAAYRITQESLTNARRHATGAEVRVSLQYESDRVALSVENGCGTSAADASSEQGVGIIGMRERAATVGGQLDATPVPTGFRVHAELPYEPIP